MTIDEAIVHAREVAEKNYKQGFLCHANPNVDKLDGCIKCAKEHEQLAEWLEELKALRHEANEWRNAGYAHGYNKAIDDYRTEICKAFVQAERNGNYRFYAVEIKQLIADLGEQLKEGGVDAGSI